LLLILFGSMFGLMLLGMDIAFVLMVSTVLVIGLTHVVGDLTIPFEVVPQHLFAGVDSFSFTAIPLFILAGEIMNRGGITDKLLEFAQKLVGHIRGGVAQSGVILNMIMSGVSGSAVADCAATGSVLIPAMKKDGYSPEKSAAIIASASTMGPVIPPSIPMIIIGSLAGVSVGKLFLAGVIPGLLMGLSLMVYIYFYAKKKGMQKREKAKLGDRFRATKNAALALGMPFIILGSILFGIASPTESAVIGVLYALILTLFVYKTINFKSLYEVLLNAAISTGAIMITVAAGVIYGWVATFLNLGDYIQGFLLSISDNKYVILLAVNVLLLLMGMVLEAIPIILLMVPILFPILTGMGIDPIHFSIIMIINLMMGLIHPPLGLHLFITSAIAKVSITRVAFASIPFMIVLLLVLIVVTYIPQISLFLPNLMN
jgi:C4-dicarboxylate transporter DctM subunit